MIILCLLMMYLGIHKEVAIVIHLLQASCRVVVWEERQRNEKLLMMVSHLIEVRTVGVYGHEMLTLSTIHLV